MPRMFTIGNPLNFAALRDLSRGGVDAVDFGRGVRGHRPRRRGRGADRAARRAGLWREHGLWAACANPHPQRSARAPAAQPGVVARRRRRRSTARAGRAAHAGAQDRRAVARIFGRAPRAGRCAGEPLQRGRVAARAGQGLGRRERRSRAARAHVDRVVRRGRSRVRREGPERRRRSEARRASRRIKLAAKEGLALLNGTQTSTALALVNLFAIDNLYATALVAGALSVDAAEGSASPFDARIHELRGHPGQIAAAAAYRELLADSADQLQPPRMRQGAGSLFAALPAAGHGRLQRPDRSGARGAAARSQRRHRQSAGVRRRRRGIRRGALGRQLPRRARGVRRGQPRAGRRRDRRAVRAPHRAADRRHAVGPAAVPRAAMAA